MDGDRGGDSGVDISDTEEPVVRAGKAAKRRAQALYDAELVNNQVAEEYRSLLLRML